MNNKKTICLEQSWEECCEAIKEFFDTRDRNDQEIIKKGALFLDWTKIKSEKVATESEVVIPEEYIPKKITSFEYDKLTPYIRNIVNKYYKKLDEHGKTIYKKDNSNIGNISSDEINTIVNKLIFIRGSVVWVDFGFNIGTEFGGIHPAIILRKSGENLIVIPLSSGTQSCNRSFIVEVPVVYKFQQNKRRWTSVHRIQTIHPKRIIFSNYGSVHKDVLTNISNAIKKEF